MTIDAKVARRRAMRKYILQMLQAAHRGNPGIGVEHPEIVKAFAQGEVVYTEEQIEPTEVC